MTNETAINAMPRAKFAIVEISPLLYNILGY